jgi:DNA mismatch repair protein MutS
MKQYFNVKSKYPDAILLFRVGDFYETFGEDAIHAAKILGIVLTSRNNGGSDIELAGFPHHSIEVYLPRLVKAGFRVAICEQLEKPSKEKKIVKRGVTEMITPGLVISEHLLEHKTSNYLCSLYVQGRSIWGICFLDISTGEFLVAEGDVHHMQQLIQSFKPTEFIFSRSQKEIFLEHFGHDHYYFLLDDWAFESSNNEESLKRHFGVSSLKGFGVHNLQAAISSAGAILNYLETTENRKIDHISSIRRIERESYVWLDEFTLQNLELLESQHPSGISLLKVLDLCHTPMGSRLMAKWIAMPLLHLEQIERRNSVVEFLMNQNELFQSIENELKKLGDLERIVSRISMQKINPRELYGLMKSLNTVDQLINLLKRSKFEVLIDLSSRLNACSVLSIKIQNAIKEDPPTKSNKGGLIAPGFNEELDDLRGIISNSKNLLLELQAKEAEATGIDKLKVGFNNVFGYYFEVTNKYKDKDLVPEHWVRKQTLTNSERYISDELKRLEEKILTAEDRIIEIEEQLYAQLLHFALDYIKPIQLNAQILAQLDCLCSFAKVSKKFSYVKPELNNGLKIKIKDGRHPVIEAMMPPEETYVPNDLFLDSATQQIIMITGPNMSGKSAVLRQTALICILAQMGCFVPADQASIGLIDKIFTRVGASDNISSGESTFMVEMNETANIMNNISTRSLILLDEIGRGTSTYDGISIAWAIAEFLHEHQTRAKTLFATHYHELNELQQRFDRIKNFTIDTRVKEKELIFLRKLIPGSSKHSFGILVAKMAAMPDWIVNRAQTILQKLEESKNSDLSDDSETIEKLKSVDYPLQLSLFAAEDEELQKLKKELVNLDINQLTPIESLMKIVEWQRNLSNS